MVRPLSSGPRSIARVLDDGDPHGDTIPAPPDEWRFYEAAEFSWSGDLQPMLGFYFYGYGTSPEEALIEASTRRADDFHRTFDPYRDLPDEHDRHAVGRRADRRLFGDAPGRSGGRVMLVGHPLTEVHAGERLFAPRVRWWPSRSRCRDGHFWIGGAHRFSAISAHASGFGLFRLRYGSVPAAARA